MHSYGTTTGALALAGADLGVDDAVMLSSPGLTVDRAADLHAGDVWYAMPPDDRLAPLGNLSWEHPHSPLSPGFGGHWLEVPDGRPPGPRRHPVLGAPALAAEPRLRRALVRGPRRRRPAVRPARARAPPRRRRRRPLPRRGRARRRAAAAGRHHARARRRRRAREPLGLPRQGVARGVGGLAVVRRARRHPSTAAKAACTADG